MKQGFGLFMALLAGFWALQGTVGFPVAANMAYTALTVLAAVIGGTFLWLWRERATPLALGMAFSWSGTASIAAWWGWARGQDAADWMRGHPALFVFLALYTTGAILHFAVIGRSLGRRLGLTMVAATAAVALLALVLGMV